MDTLSIIPECIEEQDYEYVDERLHPRSIECIYYGDPESSSSLKTDNPIYEHVQVATISDSTEKTHTLRLNIAVQPVDEESGIRMPDYEYLDPDMTSLTKSIHMADCTVSETCSDYDYVDPAKATLSLKLSDEATETLSTYQDMLPTGEPLFQT